MQDNNLRTWRILSTYTDMIILLQAWCVHCLITVQIVLVMTNLVQEFCHNFDQVLNQHVVVQSFFWSRLFQTKLSFIFVQCFLL